MRFARTDDDRRRCSTTATSSSSDEQLASTLQGYRVFPLDGCSFMIKETPDQKLVVSDTFVTDGVTGEPKQLTQLAGLPASLSSPTSFQEIEWAAEYPGNELEDKPAVRWVLKTYLIAEAEDGSLDFDRVVLLDAGTQSVSFPSVTRLAPEGTPGDLLELRIRESGLVIDTVESLPDAESVVRSKLAGLPATSVLEGEGGGALEGTVLGEGVAGEEDEEEAFDASIEDDSEDLDDFLDSGDGDEIDSDDEEFGDGEDDLDEDGDDFD